ncbi:hypothetical protein ACSBR2_009830 [Camellia fascicularis]
MESSDTSFSLSSLLCQENESSLNESEESHLNSNPCSVSESDDEYIQLLIHKETTFESNRCLSANACSAHNENWFKCARLSAIKWILNARASFGFRFSTAILSLTYFDRFLSRRSIDIGKYWAIRLLSVACLSLAAKMEELKVPSLSQYHIDGYSFESNVILRMELLVLNTLEWKLDSITPFAYLHYFITKFCDSKPKELVSGVTELILAISKEIKLMDIRPSVIALAAVLAASDDQLTRTTMDSKMSGVIPSWGSLEKEDMYSCYNQMKEIKMGKSKTPNSIVLATKLSSIDALEKSSINSAVVGSKRRLTYSESDQKCPPQKIQRP